MRALLVGDSHCDIKFFERDVFPAAAEHKVDRIFQVGDFGYYERHLGGIRFLRRLNALAVQHNCEVWWIDGNHEDHKALRYGYFPVTGNPEPVPIRSHIIHMPRGSMLAWGGLRWLACGGAFSVNRQHMTHNVDWFDVEVVSDAEVRRCASRGRADILLCHDAPAGFDVLCQHKDPTVGMHSLTDSNRERLRKVVDQAKVRWVFHGHWHMFQNHTIQNNYGPVYVMGLDCNHGKTKNMVVFDTENEDLWFPQAA